MYELLVKLLLISALSQFGISLFEAATCHSKECNMRIESASRDILSIKWKPITVFPDEAKKFR